MNTRTEMWLNHQIRFVEKTPNDWWAVLKDVAKALTLRTDKVAARLEKDNLSKVPLLTVGGSQEMLVVNEYGIYETVFESRKKEAKEFKRWVFEMLKQLRQSSGLAGFEVFRMLDKEHQKEAMQRLRQSMDKPERISFIKANTIANKAVSNRHGYSKMLKKDEMPPELLPDREMILDDTVNLMATKKRFGLDVSVSKAIYNKYGDGS